MKGINVSHTEIGVLGASEHGTRYRNPKNKHNSRNRRGFSRKVLHLKVFSAKTDIVHVNCYRPIITKYQYHLTSSTTRHSHRTRSLSRTTPYACLDSFRKDGTMSRLW